MLHIYDAFASRTPSSTCWCATSRPPHAADGYARAPPATSAWRWSPGPGSPTRSPASPPPTWILIPMVIITGQVPTPPSAGRFQECDTVGITRPIVKHNFLVRTCATWPDDDQKGFHIARTGRPGPVVVDILKDVSPRRPSSSPATRERWKCARTTRCEGPRRPDPQGGAAAAGRRPAHIYTGGGVAAGQRHEGARAAHAGGPAELPGHQHADGPGAYPAVRPPVRRHAGHARHHEANWPCRTATCVGRGRASTTA